MYVHVTITGSYISIVVDLDSELVTSLPFPTYISVLYLICSLVSFDSSNSTPPLVSKGMLLFSSFAFAWYLCSCNVGFEILKNFSWLFLDKVPFLLVQVLIGVF